MSEEKKISRINLFTEHEPIAKVTDHYLITKILGDGNSSSVYLATNKRTGELRAIK
jgi:hypothetical protein